MGEQELEQEVSNYLKRLFVITIDIDDVPGPESQRAYVERALIALLTEEHIYLEESSGQWLGHFSAQKSIRNSGLWNVRCVGSNCDFSSVRKTLKLLGRQIVIS
jgi:hypothetical protein